MPAKYRIPIRKADPHDPQQWRFYRMEVEAIGARGYTRSTKPTIRRLVRSLTRAYRVPEPEVQFKDLGSWSAECCNGVLTFNPSRNHAFDVLTVAHEFAHHLHNQFHTAPFQQPHGPQFVACYMSVLDTARMIPVCAMKAVCDKWKIQYVDPGERNSFKDLTRVVIGTA